MFVMMLHPLIIDIPQFKPIIYERPVSKKLFYMAWKETAGVELFTLP
jgi:hypothetical protein